jgi:hypothetical protein
LNEYFDRYQTRGFIKRLSQVQTENAAEKLLQKRLSKRTGSDTNATKILKRAKAPVPSAPEPTPATIVAQIPEIVDKIPIPAPIPAPEIMPAIKPLPKPHAAPPHVATKKPEHRIVGRIVRADPAELLRTNLDRSSIPISLKPIHLKR